jgi:hypothetical protein
MNVNPLLRKDEFGVNFFGMQKSPKGVRERHPSPLRGLALPHEGLL